MVAHQAPIPGTLQARILEGVAISFSSAWKWKVKVKSLSRTQLVAPPWTVAYQAPPFMGFPRQEYWSRLSKSLQTINAGERVEEKEPSYTVGENVHQCSYYEQ